MNVEHCRSIGAEYVSHSIWNELKLTEFFLYFLKGGNKGSKGWNTL